MILFKLFLFHLFCCIIYVINHASSNLDEITKLPPRLWIISFDGLRWDFLKRTKLKTFQWIINNGISSKWMEPVFITKTFPTHFSMATGLYVENHGIVGNSFYDSLLQEQFTVAKGSKNPKWWTGGEPIWITATKNNIPSGVSFWPGSEVSYDSGGVRPEHYLAFDKNVPVTKRIDQVIQWFLNGTRLVSFYHSEPDGKAHAFGPESIEVIEEMKAVDEVLGYALAQLKANNLFETTNLIIVSDHGHQQIYQIVYLNNSINPFDISLMKQIDSEGVLFSFELVNHLNELEKNKYLNNLQKYLGKNYRLYKSPNEFPERWHYRGATNRISNYNILAEPGYELLVNPPPGGQDDSIKGGNHGYDNKNINMKPIFLAYGPSFRKKPRKIKEVHQVDLYGLALKLLQLDGISPKNGSTSRIKKIIFGT